jgi:hypothetical protein
VTTIQLEPAALTTTYIEVQQFYARHMHLLDAGRAAEWAETFTADGVFDAPTLPAPTRGRAALTAAVTAAHQAMVEAGEVRRHWHGMVALDPREDGSLHVTCYAQVIHTPRGGESRLHRSCVCEDTLVREDGEWKVAHRRVTRDDLP